MVFQWGYKYSCICPLPFIMHSSNIGALGGFHMSVYFISILSVFCQSRSPFIWAYNICKYFRSTECATFIHFADEKRPSLCLQYACIYMSSIFVLYYIQRQPISITDEMQFHGDAFVMRILVHYYRLLPIRSCRTGLGANSGIHICLPFRSVVFFRQRLNPLNLPSN